MMVSFSLIFHPIKQGWRGASPRTAERMEAGGRVFSEDEGDAP